MRWNIFGSEAEQLYARKENVYGCKDKYNLFLRNLLLDGNPNSLIKNDI